MKNISLDGQPIKLRTGTKYIVIDALYVSDITKKLSVSDSTALFEEIRSFVFPHTDTPFAEYVPTKDIFLPEQIRKIVYNSMAPGQIDVLSTDTGLLVFINEKIFSEIVSIFDYDKLTDSQIEVLDIQYWESISSNYELYDLALISAPGVGSGFEFEGSGTYRII